MLSVENVNLVYNKRKKLQQILQLDCKRTKNDAQKRATTDKNLYSTQYTPTLSRKTSRNVFNPQRTNVTNNEQQKATTITNKIE